ncbi:hypothetical protein [Burkholderia oklahomensis]|uniref:hypothetical protein n=1 Tax=Burkholderia oklahomensis TaxID=342113 RepID=UPI0013923B3B|nr:hypothetical protein [Burkholderia oklahomensis]
MDYLGDPIARDHLHHAIGVGQLGRRGGHGCPESVGSAGYLSDEILGVRNDDGTTAAEAIRFARSCLRHPETPGSRQQNNRARELIPSAIRAAGRPASRAVCRVGRRTMARRICQTITWKNHVRRGPRIG